MNKTKQKITPTLMCLLVIGIAAANGQTPTSPRPQTIEFRLTNLVAEAHRERRPAFSLMSSSPSANFTDSRFSVTPMAAGPNLTVLGAGTLGRLTKWAGFSSSNSLIGDSTIFEDKFGKVGIGTDAPTSKLTVAGPVQSTSGGFQFPDGTVQTSSAAGALFTIAHNATLTGNGTQASPLAVASPLEVRDLDNPARQPVQLRGNCNMTNGQVVCLTAPITYLVPQGKRLVIEYASMQAGIQEGQSVTMFIQIEIPNAALIGRHFLNLSAPAHDGLFAGGPFTSVGQALRIYVNPGFRVVVNGVRNNGTGTGSYEVSISGHLVDIP